MGVAWEGYWKWEKPGRDTRNGSVLGGILEVGVAWEGYWRWEWPGRDTGGGHSLCKPGPSSAPPGGTPQFAPVGDG